MLLFIGSEKYHDKGAERLTADDAICGMHTGPCYGLIATVASDDPSLTRRNAP
jgi:hypothetical protein